MNIKLLSIAALLILPLTISAQQPVEMQLHDAQKGIISMRNNFPNRDLGDCRITWILLENGHKIEIVQINNLNAEPNATAYLEFPYSSKPFVYGGERWIRIEIRDKEKANDEILAWAQFFLPETTSPPPIPFSPELLPEISISEKNDSIKLSNKIFATSFSKKTGLIASLKYYNKERLLQGPSLATKPSLDSLKSKLISITQSQTDKRTALITSIIQYQENEGQDQYTTYSEVPCIRGRHYNHKQHSRHSR